MKKDFYIGWKNDLPKRNKKAVGFLILGLIVVLPIVAYLIVTFETPFNEHHFELGVQREFYGVYFNKPQPMLVLDKQTLADGFNPEALLVGYGKFGATSIMEEVQAARGNLNGREIRIRGTLLYGDGKIVIELTNGIDAVIGTTSKRMFPVQQTQPKSSQLIGEIIDPKCWFGAMKPAEGKVHKSCAIRCISGGIPPVLKVKKNGEHLYYLLVANGSENLNESLLDFVAEEVEVSGEVFYQNGWNVLTTSSKNFRYLTSK